MKRRPCSDTRAPKQDTHRCWNLLLSYFEATEEATEVLEERRLFSDARGRTKTHIVVGTSLSPILEQLVYWTAGGAAFVQRALYAKHTSMFESPALLI